MAFAILGVAFVVTGLIVASAEMALVGTGFVLFGAVVEAAVKRICDKE